MAEGRTIEIFSAGCPVCEHAVELVQRLAGSDDDVVVRDMRDAGAASRAATFGVRSVPAVVIDDVLAPCCAGRGIDESDLRQAGLGKL